MYSWKDSMLSVSTAKETPKGLYCAGATSFLNFVQSLMTTPASSEAPMAEKECEFSLFTRLIEFSYRRRLPAEFSLTKKSLDIKTPNFRLPNKRALQPGAGALERPNLKHFEFIKSLYMRRNPL